MHLRSSDLPGCLDPSAAAEKQRFRVSGYCLPLELLAAMVVALTAHVGAFLSGVNVPRVSAPDRSGLALLPNHRPSRNEFHPKLTASAVGWRNWYQLPTFVARTGGRNLLISQSGHPAEKFMSEAAGTSPIRVVARVDHLPRCRQGADILAQSRFNSADHHGKNGGVLPS